MELSSDGYPTSVCGVLAVNRGRTVASAQRSRKRLVERLRLRGIERDDVLAAIGDTPRHIFVDEALSSRAYEDTALPIGYGQTISQPFIVAVMTQALLNCGVTGKVLEVGTGSGYQTSVLARVVRQVISVERVQALLSMARDRLRQQQLMNVLTVHGDGYQGWPAEGPYQGILVTAAPPELPTVLLEQLSEDGVLIVPVGPQGEAQRLLAIRRDPEGGWSQEDLGAVSFVPLVEGRR